MMRCFWEYGYEGASMSRLEEAAGVDRRQLSRDFGSKRGLFIQALDDFAAFAGELYLERLEDADSGLGSIQATLRELSDLPKAPQGELGCLVCNTSREELARADAEVADRVSAFFRRIEDAYMRALTHGAARGELSAERGVLRAKARHLFAVHVALFVLVRAGSPRPVLRDVVQCALASLKGPGAS